MSDWASNEKDKMLFENWRSYVTEQEEQNSSVGLKQDGDDKILQNILSTDNSDSLYNVLKSVLGDKEDFDNIVKALAKPIFDMADDEGIMLENISLSGDRAEGIRVMDLSSEGGKKLISVLNKLRS